MDQKTVLVTGGAGFIGSHLTEALIRANFTVVVVDNFNRFYSPSQKANNLSAVKNRPHFFLHRADIRDVNILKEIFSKYNFDCVIHLAAMAGVPPSLENPRLYADVNVIGTICLLERVKEFGIKHFIFGSSSSVYGDRQVGPFKESDSTDKQISPYGATKKAGELLCQVYAKLYHIQTTIIRFFTVYGPRNRPDMACFRFLDSLMKNHPLMRFGSGNSSRDYTFIDDVVEGIIAAVKKPFNFETINLGNSHPVVLNELISTLETVTGKKANINKLPAQPGDVNQTYADIKKAQSLLGYQPKVTLLKGISQLFDWYTQHYQ